MSLLSKQLNISGTTFKLEGIMYNINYAYGHYSLRKVNNGKLGDKSELTNKSIEVIFDYIASIHRISSENVREAYSHVEAAA